MVSILQISVTLKHPKSTMELATIQILSPRADVNDYLILDINNRSIYDELDKEEEKK